MAFAAFVAGLTPEERARLTAAAARCNSPEAGPVIYADNLVVRDLLPPRVVAWPWDSGRALSLIFLDARADESLILTREGWLRGPSPDLDRRRRAEDLGAPLRRALLDHP